MTTNRFAPPALMDPEPPQPLNPAPGPHRPFPSPTPHISIEAISSMSFFSLFD